MIICYVDIFIYHSNKIKKIKLRKEFAKLAKNYKIDKTLVMEEEMVLSPAQLQSASKLAAGLGTGATNQSSQELHVDYSIRDKWTAVSPRKKWSKKTAESTIPIEGPNNQHPISQEEFEHPQPVSKRISFGLPISMVDSAVFLDRFFLGLTAVHFSLIE